MEGSVRIVISRERGRGRVFVLRRRRGFYIS